MDSPNDSPKKRTVRDIAFTWLLLALIPTTVATVIGFAASHHHLAELSVHFKVPYWWVALFTCLGLLILKRWGWGLLALAVLLIHSVGIVPWYIPRVVQLPAEASTNLTIMTANVLSTNETPELVIEFIRSKDPDILLLQEISPEWIKHLQPLIDSNYPYALLEPQTDNFGMATLSKIPVESLTLIDPLSFGIPIIEAKITINGRAVSVLNYHPLPPGHPVYVNLRNDQLAYVPTYALAQPDLCIVAGDFNVTPWSPHYTSMIGNSGLYNTRKGFGLLLTWPKPSLIPIDHVLASPAIHTLSMEIGPRNGSDHRPMVVQFYIPEK